MGLAILLGVIIFAIAEAVSKRRKLALERLQLKEMELEMEAEKNAVMPGNGTTAFGSLEQGGDERGQQMFNAFKWQEELSERQMRDGSVNSQFPLGPVGAGSDMNLTMGSGRGATVHGTGLHRNSESGAMFDQMGSRNNAASATRHQDGGESFDGRDSWPDLT